MSRHRVARGSRSRAFTALGSCWVALTALAAADLRVPGRFDDRIRYREGGSIAVEARPHDSLDPRDELRAGWQAFRQRHGAWRIFLDERTGLPVLASGRGIAWLTPTAFVGASLQDLELRARAFLEQQRELLGDWANLLALDHEASTKLRDDHWQLVFRQQIDGVRVENARLDFHVKQGRLTMFGATHWGLPTTNGVPAIDAAQARSALGLYLGVSLDDVLLVGEPELSIVALDAEPGAEGSRPWAGPRGTGLQHALIWRLRFREPGAAPLWVGEIDAHDGRIRAFYDGAHYTTIRGGVFPVSNDGDCVAGGCEIAGFPMPFADFTESAQVEQFAGGFGNLICAEPTSSLETNLVGSYVRINDRCGALVETGACDDGVDLGLKRGENCDVAPGASPGNSAAARSAYYHVNRIAEAARFYDPANAWLQDQVTVNVNVNGTCNAFWNGDINMYAAGSGCGNTGELQGVLVHEWGHGYDENDGGGFDVTSEAYADVVAIFAGRDSCVSRGWYNDGRTCSGYGDTCLTCTGIRDHDWAARIRNTPTTPENFLIQCPSGPGGPCGREAHCESYPISESIFDFATRDLPASGIDPDSAWQLAERLWYDSRPGSGGEIFNCFRVQLAHSCFASHWFQRMLVVDDDDADLSNGTPHAAALFAAFDRHNIACGAPEDPENQSTSGCPALTAPVLTALETPSGTELSWSPVAGAEAYRVYRGDLGCDRQQVPIAALSEGSTTFFDSEADPGLPRYYRIEAFGTNPACQSPVSNCAATPLAARLQRVGQAVLDGGSNGNGIPDPGETVAIPVTLFNSGLDSAMAVVGHLRLADPGQGRVLDADASWLDLAPSELLESETPHFGVVVFESTPCGDALSFELEADAANAAPTSDSFQIPLGDRQRDFSNDQDVAIPAETTVPIVSTLLVDAQQTISDVDVTINLGHGLESELIVELTSPEGTTVRLHDQTEVGTGIHARYDLERLPDGPGTMQDFAGETTQGTWTLSIEDIGSESPPGGGTLTDWTLHFDVAGGFDCEPVACPESTPAEAVAGLRIDLVRNGPDYDLVFGWSEVPAVAGYHVLQSNAPAFDSEVELTGSTSGGASLIATNGANTTPPLTFFQVRAINSCDQEGP